MPIGYPEMRVEVEPAVAAAATGFAGEQNVKITPGAERAVRMSILREGTKKGVETMPQEVGAVAREVFEAARAGGPTPEGRAPYLAKSKVRRAWDAGRENWLATLWPEIDWAAAPEGDAPEEG